MVKNLARRSLIPVRSLPFFLLFLLGQLAFSAQHGVPVPFPNYSYPGRFESIRKIDFQNMTLHVWWKDRKPGFSFQLKDGEFSQTDDSGFYSAEFISVHYLDSAESESQRALVIFYVLSGRGSSSRNHYAQVFELRNGTLRIVQEIEWDSKVHIGNHAYASFDPKRKELTVRTAHFLEGDANCCISAVEVIAFRWNGNRLVQKSVRLELSEYGKREGKKLPPQ